jgi:hypothetical protein
MATLHDADHDAMFGSDLHVYSPKPSSMTDQQHPITPPEPPTDEEIKRFAEMLEFFDEVVLIRAALERWGQR